ncbi:hypothetical protein [Bradyrhizobium sp. HKCCYLS20291]|uniref:hypothetical protein n=1 Tax=Bradyrhizobium sp. HKCCYLS20291 TaxID=3420766 RepID=UPI003EB7C27D
MTILEAILLMSPWAGLLGLIMWDVNRAQKPTPKDDERSRNERVLANWTRILGLSTILLFIATLFSAFILHQTDNAIHRQMELAERDAEPYISVVDLGTTGQPYYLNNRLNWNFRLKNLGKGLARDIYITKQAVSGAKIVDTDALEFMFQGDFTDITVWSEPIDRVEFDRLMASDAGVWVWIQLDYRDNFDGKAHSNFFCFARQVNGLFQKRSRVSCPSVATPKRG